MVETLVVGAGPTGLAAALFLNERGLPVRVVERRTERSVYSKAFGVNCRTLTLLEPSGVTETLLADGWRAGAFNIWRNGRRLVRLELAGVDCPYPFMQVLAQSETERILEEAVRAKGVSVERGVEVVGCSLRDDGTASLELSRGDGERETIDAARVLAADGAHSLLRESAGLTMDGSTMPDVWRLFDLHLQTPLPPDEGNTFLLDRGGMFVLRLHDDVWRVMGRHEDPISQLPAGSKPGEVLWTSDFRLSHRITSAFSRGPMYFAGDAAHVHSPIGARGMNLGIEDAWVFAQLAAEDRLAEYEPLRHRAVTKVVRRVEGLTEMARGEHFGPRLVRRLPFLLRVAAPLMRGSLARWTLGLDHELGV